MVKVPLKLLHLPSQALLDTVYLPRRGGWLEVEFNLRANHLINHAYIMKPQEKLWTPKLGRTPLVSSTLHVVIHGCEGKLMRPDSTEQRRGNSAFGTRLDFTLCVYGPDFYLLAIIKLNHKYIPFLFYESFQ